MERALQQGDDSNSCGGGGKCYSLQTPFYLRLHWGANAYHLHLGWFASSSFSRFPRFWWRKTGWSVSGKLVWWWSGVSRRADSTWCFRNGPHRSSSPASTIVLLPWAETDEVMLLCNHIPLRLINVTSNQQKLSYRAVWVLKGYFSLKAIEMNTLKSLYSCNDF